MALKTTIKSLKEGFVVLYGDSPRDLRETEVFSTREAAEKKAKNLRAAYSIVQVFEAEEDYNEQLNKITESIEQHLDLDKLFAWINDNKEEALEAWYEFEDEEENFNGLRVVESFLNSIGIDLVSLGTEYGNKVLEFIDENFSSIRKKMKEIEYNFDDDYNLDDSVNTKEALVEHIDNFDELVAEAYYHLKGWLSKDEKPRLEGIGAELINHYIAFKELSYLLDSPNYVKEWEAFLRLVSTSLLKQELEFVDDIFENIKENKMKKLKESTEDIKSVLERAYKGSYFTVEGAGGEPKEWFDGLNEMFAEEGIGQIKEYISFKGKDINQWARLTGTNAYADDLTFFAFPLDSLDAGKLPIFKLRFGARWFDDIVDNNADREGFHPMGKSHYDEDLDVKEALDDSLPPHVPGYKGRWMGASSIRPGMYIRSKLYDGTIKMIKIVSAYRTDQGDYKVKYETGNTDFYGTHDKWGIYIKDTTNDEDLDVAKELKEWYSKKDPLYPLVIWEIRRDIKDEDSIFKDLSDSKLEELCGKIAEEISSTPIYEDLMKQIYEVGEKIFKDPEKFKSSTSRKLKENNSDLDQYEDEFEYLEYLRKSGVTNMYGAAPYLKEAFGIDIREAREILNLWMSNYDELMQKYGWDRIDEDLKEAKQSEKDTSPHDTIEKIKTHRLFKDLDDKIILKVIRLYTKDKDAKADSVDSDEIIEFIINLGGWGPFIFDYISVDKRGLDQPTLISLVKKDPKLLKAIKKFADDNNLLGAVSSDIKAKKKTDDNYINAVFDLSDRKVLPDTIKELSRLYYLDE